MEEQYLIKGLKTRNQIVFDFIFHYYYSGLCAFCEKMVNDQAAAEDIVQNLFVTLWLKHQQLDIKTSLKSYLFTAVRNRSHTTSISPTICIQTIRTPVMRTCIHDRFTI